MILECQGHYIDPARSLAFSPFLNMLKKSSPPFLNILNMVKAFFLNDFPKQALVFTCLQSKSFENTAGKREIAHNEQFLLFPQCFLPVWRTFCHFHLIQNCRLQTLSIWKSLKFIVWERVNGHENASFFGKKG